MSMSPLAARYLRFQPSGPKDSRGAALLERLLARADAVAEAADWRADAFRVIAPLTPMPAVAAAAYCAAAGPRAPGWVFLATPVHYLAELSNVRFAADGILTLDAAQAEALALDFNRVWRDSGVDLWASSSRLFCSFDVAVEAATSDPELARGRHLENFLPTGKGAVRLRRLMSEIEMWLFEHPVNRKRLERAQLAVSALWLWGGGAALSSLPEVPGAAAGGDVFFDAFPAVADRCADVMVVDTAPNTPEWADMQARWLAPTLVELRRGRIEQLQLSAGERCYTVGAHWRRRFWRPAKPWWEYFE